LIANDILCQRLNRFTSGFWQKERTVRLQLQQKPCKRKTKSLFAGRFFLLNSYDSRVEGMGVTTTLMRAVDRIGDWSSFPNEGGFFFFFFFCVVMCVHKTLKRFEL
jgi:hypothetical protein